MDPKSMPSLALLLAGIVGPAMALGTLSVADTEVRGSLKASPGAPAAIELRRHDVRVLIIDGFARTEVHQTYYNPNADDLEATYAVPLPKNACLSELTVFSGDRVLRGEVLRKRDAEKAYAEEKDAGHDTAIAKKDAYRRIQFAISPVRAQSKVRLQMVYYQPLQIELGVGRYQYPVVDGGSDTAGTAFWTSNTSARTCVSVNIDLRSSSPVDDVRLPGLERFTRVTRHDRHHFEAFAATPDDTTRDLVFYYRLQKDLPGRVELVAHRSKANHPGTFMLVHTPGIDLKPLTSGADYLLILDVSGSMQTEDKLRIMVEAVSRTLRTLKPADRFQILTFAGETHVLTDSWQNAEADAVAAAIQQISTLRARGSTNLFSALSTGLKLCTERRTTSVLLITDGVANEGIVDPKEYRALLAEKDVRVFSFLMGNSANWPLMDLITRTSGGFYAAMSNADDLLGQLILAGAKLKTECLHDVQISWSGLEVFSVSALPRRVYQGQQVVLFGRYARPGKGVVTLRTRISGTEHVYETAIELPDVDTRAPAIERLWAMNLVEELQFQRDAGLMDADAVKTSVEDLGTRYQLVTDETSMVVMSDDRFHVRSIERRNLARTAEETRTHQVAVTQPVSVQRVDTYQPTYRTPVPSRRVDTYRPTFRAPAPSLFSLPRGGGAVDPLGGLLALTLVALGAGACANAKDQ